MLAIDPGLQGTGLALFEEPSCHPAAVTVIERTTKGEWWDRALHLGKQVYVWTYDHAGGELTPQDLVVCEFPQYQESAGRSMGWRTGDLQRLTFLTGVFAARLRRTPFRPVVPSAWKGQLPKSVVEDRIRTRLGAAVCAQLKIRTHAWDAVGIGLWALDHPEELMWPRNVNRCRRSTTSPVTASRSAC